MKAEPTSTPPEVELDAAPEALVAGRYRVIERIGDGAMGSVYLAEHEALHRRVALKFLHDEFTGNQEIAARFAREAVAAARIDHPNVIAVYDSGVDERGRCFLAMEYCIGEELRAVLTREGALPRERALDLARQIASALDHAHGLGIVHRDIKPENVLVLRRDDGSDAVKVIDFGIAKVFLPEGPSGTALTRSGIVLGTPDYMAPEQALGASVDHRADLYALSVTTFEMLLGRRPFEDDDVMTLLMRHINATPPAPTSVRPDAGFSVAIDQVFAKGLAKSPGDRYPSAAEFVAAFEYALNAPVAPTVPAPRSAPPPIRARLGELASMLVANAREGLSQIVAYWLAVSRRARVSIAAGAVLVVVCVVGLSSHHRPPGHPARPTLLAETAPRSHVEAARPPVAAGLRGRIDALRSRPDLATATPRDRQRAALTLEALHAQDPDDPAVAYVLGDLYARERSTGPQSLAAYRDALRVAPELAHDDALVSDVVRIYASASTRLMPAEAMLRGSLAEAAPDAMIDVCIRGAPGHARVATLLEQAPFAERLDPVQRAIVALTVAHTCEARKAAVERLARDGDARVLPLLRRIPTGSGCGFLGLGTCNSCLGIAVPTAIHVIEQRIGDAAPAGHPSDATTSERTTSSSRNGLRTKAAQGISVT